ncbi:MAG: glycoside hydrolase family 32 protein [Candidatus Hodarchaeota archaeon]
MNEIPKFLKHKGKLSLDNDEILSLTIHFEFLNQKTEELFTIPVEELLEEMVGKDVLIKVYELKDGHVIEDPATLKDLNEDRMKGTRQLREQLLQDKYRPGYHFAIPEDIGRPGDPNGAFFGRDGRYHLMYLYDRRDTRFCWGHMSSLDLVHWRHHPDALLPPEKTDGCFSGGAFLDDDGTCYASYWIVHDQANEVNGIAIAHSSDYHYENWENLPEIVLPAHKMGVSKVIDKNGNEKYVANADPSNIWKKDGVYYMQCGNMIVLNDFGRDPENPLYEETRGDWVDLYKSTDLKNWEYVHKFYEFDPSRNWTDETEDDMCPSFLPLPTSPDGGEMSDKYLQLFIAHNKGCQYYIGTYDKENDRFIPEKHGRMSWIDNTFFAPEALIDGKGRQIMWAWLLDNPDPSNEDVLLRGWCGVYGLPRVLWLGDDGTLRQKVPPELEVLRHNEKQWGGFTLECDLENRVELEGVVGDSCEISLKVIPSCARKVGFQVCTSPDGREETRVYYDMDEKALVFDSRNSSLQGTGRPVPEKAPFEPKDKDECIHIRVFIDKCVVEVFINDVQAITRRVFTTLDESLGIYLFCEGGDCDVEELTTWEMMPSNPY